MTNLIFRVMQATADGTDVNGWDFSTWADAEYARCVASLDALASGSTDIYYVTDENYKLCEQDPAYAKEAPRNRVTDPATRTDADALRDTANHHQGSRVHAADADHGRQLRRAGLTGRRGGLTRKGSIVAEKLRNEALDAAFGAL